MKLALLSIFLALPLLSQTSIPAGLVYQAAVSSGIEYISPSAGQAIINQKSALNWKNIALTTVGGGALAAATAGIGGVVTIAKPVLEGLMIGHIIYDQFGQQILQAGAPNPNNLPPVLQMAGTMNPSATSCAENSIYAASISGTLLPLKKGVLPPRPVTIILDGAVVTFSPQSVAVLKNASGGKIKGFMVVDVLACMPVTAPAPVVNPVTPPVPPRVSDADVAQLRNAINAMHQQLTVLQDQLTKLSNPSPSGSGMFGELTWR